MLLRDCSRTSASGFAGSFGKLRLTMNRRDAVKTLLVVLGSARAGAVGPAVRTLIGTGSPGFTDREVNNPWA